MSMPKLRVHNLAMSLDGFVAGADQTIDDPLGVDGERLHDWVFQTKFGREMIGESGGDLGIDNDYLEQGVDNIGATIMGRNMFGPVRGPWGGEDWRGWWGDTPPYHHPVFVLTHHPRPPIEMNGGTTFHFVDDGIESVLERAFDAAAGADVRLGGGASTVRQYLRARLVDELHVPIVPRLLGRGERLFDDLSEISDAYECAELVSSPSVCHVRLVRISG
jgi:dihydrofolate reductase